MRSAEFGRWTIDPKEGTLRFNEPDIPGLAYEIPLWEIIRAA